MSIVYDTITNSTDTIKYASFATNTSLYMDSNFVSTFGPIWVPRVYGKDLTAFEIASSGKVAITINDVHSLDISRSNFTNANNYTNIIEGYSNTAVELRVNETDVRVVLDAASNNILVDASSNVTINAKNGDIRMNASNSFYLNSLSNLTLNASESNIYIVMDQGTNDMNLYTSNNFSLLTSNTMNIDINSNANINVHYGNIAVAALASNLSLYASNNFNITSSNDFFIKTTSNIEAFSYDGEILVKSLTSNMFMYSSNNYDITASNNYDVNINSNITMNTHHGEFTMRSLTSNIVMFSSNNYTISTSNDYILESLSNINVETTRGNINIQSSTSNISLYSSNNFRIHASNNYALETTSNINIKSHHANINISSHESNVTLYSSNDYKVSVSNNYTMNVLSNIDISSIYGNITTLSYSNIKFNAHESNVYLNMNVPADTMELYALSNININTSNNFIIDARSNVSFTTSNFNVYSKDRIIMNSSNYFQLTALDGGNITACNDLVINASNLNISLGNDMGFSAYSNIEFSCTAGSANPVFIVQPGRILVQGDIELSGALNTSNIVSTTVNQSILKVDNKQIVVADGNANSISTDGLATNDQSGLVINGYPGGDSNWIYEDDNKSFLWNYGSSGLPALGTSGGIDTESFWELQGGSFRMTYKKNYGTSNSPDIKDISYGFRINEHEELELVKKFYDANTSGYLTRRVARFGRVY